MIKEYHKIETVYNRNTEGTKKLVEGDFRNKTVEYLKNLPFYWTEKIDGTNIRIIWDGHNIEFRGRTDKAQIPQMLFEYLNNKFNNNETEELFEQIFGEKEVILFGEGYGTKIQGCGSKYRDDNSFILFDVCINDHWLERENVESIAKTFNIEIVPIVGVGTLEQAVEYVKTKPKSKIAFDGDFIMEGVVARPLCELNDKNGNRIIVKIKVHDFDDVA